MSLYTPNKSMFRYTVLAFLMLLAGVAVIVKGIIIMTSQRGYWNQVAASVKHDSLTIDPVRGNILSAGGQGLACNLPEYRVFLDFVALKAGKADTLWHDSLGHATPTLHSLCQGLNKVLPERTPEQYLAHLEEGYKKDNRYWLLVDHRITYNQYQQLLALPLLRLPAGVSGFGRTEYMVRNRPYGSLAAALIGNTYKESGKAYSGLELVYDSVLRGTPGFQHRRKVLNRWVNMPDSAAIDGCDIVTTIDVSMQDLAERSLIRELREVGGYTGVAIVMEVQTGDIKAMVNLDRDPKTGEYREGRNHAIADWLEPGSVFKTASFMVALDDGKIDTTTTVDTGCGIMEMYGSKMRDHNWHRGGYGVLTVPKVLQVSSNIGVSYLIDRAYKDNPTVFVDGLHRVGIAENLHLPFPEYMAPQVRYPKKDRYGHWSNWSHTALPWMSIGYETHVPPISVCTFYNAIANGGKMVRPRFVTRIEHAGETVEEFPVEVLKSQICKPATLGKIQTILRQVVSIGLGKTAGSEHFDVSGKTGTAQKASGGGYKNGTVNYLLSFCGYFPSDKPRYTCIVCIHKAGLPASGGLMSGQVFHDIAEGIMAKRLKYNVKLSSDPTSVYVPDVKAGNVAAAGQVLSDLGMRPQNMTATTPATTPVWGQVRNTGRRRQQIVRTPVMPRGQMPDVIGMGARDAVYLIESRGARVVLQGTGRVSQQSKAPGTRLHKGERVTLTLL